MLPSLHQEAIENKLVDQYNKARTAQEKVAIERTAKSWFEDVPTLLQDFEKRTGSKIIVC